MGGIEQRAETVATDMEQRRPGPRKTQRGKLALLVATMLQVRSANLMDVAACLPRPAERLDSRYQWIKRRLLLSSGVLGRVIGPRRRRVRQAGLCPGGVRCARIGRSQDRAAACPARSPGAGGARSAAGTRTPRWC